MSLRSLGIIELVSLYFSALSSAGPEIIKGRKYEQIGNGVSGLFALMKSRVSAADYEGLVKVVEKNVAKVEHVSANEKLNLLAYR